MVPTLHLLAVQVEASHCFAQLKFLLCKMRKQAWVRDAHTVFCRTLSLWDVGMVLGCWHERGAQDQIKMVGTGCAKLQSVRLCLKHQGRMRAGRYFKLWDPGFGVWLVWISVLILFISFALVGPVIVESQFPPVNSNPAWLTGCREDNRKDLGCAECLLSLHFLQSLRSLELNVLKTLSP
jgi:hypothetical protein